MSTSLRPGQVLAVGRNYLAHAHELGHDAPKSPLLFWKSPAGLARGGVVRLPRWAEGPTRIDYEGEVALVLGRDLGPGTAPLPADPWEAVSHVAAGLDVSDRDLQKQEPQWVRAKGFAGALGLGEPVERPADPTAIEVATFLDGREVQRGQTGLLLFPFRELLTWLHAWCALRAGDVILTGTPAGVGPLAPGQRIRVEVRAGAALATLELAIEAGADVPPFTRSQE